MTPNLQHRASNPGSRTGYNPENTHVRQIKSGLDVSADYQAQGKIGLVTEATHIKDKENSLNEVYPAAIVIDGAKNRNVKTAGKERGQTASSAMKVSKPPLANQIGSARDVKPTDENQSNNFFMDAQQI